MSNLSTRSFLDLRPIFSTMWRSKSGPLGEMNCDSCFRIALFDSEPLNKSVRDYKNTIFIRKVKVVGYFLTDIIKCFIKLILMNWRDSAIVVY